MVSSGVEGCGLSAPWVTRTVRAVHVALASIVILDPPPVNAAIAALWRAMRTPAFVHHYMFEAFVALFSFGFWVGVYKVVDRVPRLRKYRFGGVMRPAQQSVDAANSWLAAGAYMLLIWTYHQFKAKPPLDPAPPSVRRVGVELVCGLVAYDILEFLVHSRFHHWRVLQPFHKKHHTQTHLTSPEVLNHGLLDGFHQVALNVLAQFVSPWRAKHSLSRVLHNIVITYMLTEIHAGYDGPWCMHHVWPWLIGGAERHEVHHRNGGVYYCEFFKGLDDAFGYVERSGTPPRQERRAKCALD